VWFSPLGIFASVSFIALYSALLTLGDLYPKVFILFNFNLHSNRSSFLNYSLWRFSFFFYVFFYSLGIYIEISDFLYEGFVNALLWIKRKLATRYGSSDFKITPLY